ASPTATRRVGSVPRILALALSRPCPTWPAVCARAAEHTIRPPVRGLHDANTAGSGKGLQTDVVSIIATGRPAAKMSWPAREEELEKILGAYALRGARLIVFDNLTTPYTGGPLERVLTALDTVELRVLGKSEVPSLPWLAVVFATGNNVSVVGDTSRRALIIRLESPLESPEDRPRETLLHPDLLAWCQENRPRLVVAALTLARAHALAGNPMSNLKPWGSFEEWTKVVAAAIVWAGGTSPLLARATTINADPEKEALTTIIKDWPRLAPSGITIKDAVQKLYPSKWPPPASVEEAFGRMAPDGFDELRIALEYLVPPIPGKPPSEQRLAARLRRFKRRVVGGAYIDTEGGHAGTARWVVRAGGLGGGGGADSPPSA
ncbi:MAG: hypothetical protein L6Q84_35435, partial [Polyangiaceae bacterium]|nr:hypothetical protein [Polyangiaceae bacterium]